MSRPDMNRPIELADGLMDQLYEETDNVADLVGCLALAVRRIQGYSDYIRLSTDQQMKDIRTKEES